LSDDEPTRLPVESPTTERQDLPPLAELRQTRPAVCHECESTAPAGAHFCRSCQSYLASPWVGRLASPRRRLVAAMLDGVFKDGGLLGMATGTLIFAPGVVGRIIGVMGALYGLAALYLWSKGTTPAKKLLGMKVITEDGEPAGFWRMAIRETVGKGISTAVIGLGLVAIPFDKERQGWHDHMFDTWVVLDDED
jgi:uncharacterized RDD family membrane protein YckC/ribosomal protein L40E